MSAGLRASLLWHPRRERCASPGRFPVTAGRSRSRPPTATPSPCSTSARWPSRRERAWPKASRWGRSTRAATSSTTGPMSTSASATPTKTTVTSIRSSCCPRARTLRPPCRLLLRRPFPTPRAAPVGRRLPPRSPRAPPTRRLRRRSRSCRRGERTSELRHRYGGPDHALRRTPSAPRLPSGRRPPDLRPLESRRRRPLRVRRSPRGDQLVSALRGRLRTIAPRASARSFVAGSSFHLTNLGAPLRCRVGARPWRSHRRPVAVRPSPSSPCSPQSPPASSCSGGERARAALRTATTTLV
jgi:hypothetical protein